MAGLHLVTGATGLLGSHIVEQLRKRDYPVRVLVRPGSDTSWLRTQGVEFAEGDITDRASLDRACKGVEVVHHSAAKVGDWGEWSEFQRVTIDGTRNVIEAAVAAGVRRLVHVSSVSVYGYHTRPGTVDETHELGYKLYKWAYYSRSKIIAERLAWDAYNAGRIELAVIRPAWIYGLRDRTTIARLVNMVRDGRAKILGRGDNRLNVVYAGNVAEACVKAAYMPEANGQAFNCSNDGVLTQKGYFDHVADALGVPRVRRHVPYRLAYFAGFVLEIIGHLLRSKKPPFVTRYAVWLMGRYSYFPADKARRVLGWEPTVTYEVGIPMTVRWYLEQEKAEAGAARETRAATA